MSKTLASGQVTYYLWQDGRLVAEVLGGQQGAEVAAQYLYMGDQGLAAPVAKLTCDPVAYDKRKDAERNAKIALLNTALGKLGLGSIPTYSVVDAAKNREKYLGELRHKLYPGSASSDPFMGILLPSDDCPIISVTIGCKHK